MVNKSRVYWFLEISYKYNYRYIVKNMKQIMKLKMIEKVKGERGCGQLEPPVVWFRLFPSLNMNR